MKQIRMHSRKACNLRVMWLTHVKKTVPLFIISFSCVFEEFNLMWELPKIENKNHLQFESHQIHAFVDKLQLWGGKWGLYERQIDLI